jgi:hypothetical protein
VPLTIPVRRRIFSPASDSRSGRISGMPPATDASKSRSTPARSAASKSSVPTLASNSLLAVTTGLPFANAARMSDRAGSMPPITSTTTSTAGSSTTAAASEVSTPSRRLTGRSFETLRTATRSTRNATPARAAIISPWASMSPTSAPPTFPKPRIPIPMLVRSPLIPVILPRGRAGRLRSRVAPPREPSRRARTPLQGGSPGCSWTPSSDRKRR